MAILPVKDQFELVAVRAHRIAINPPNKDPATTSALIAGN
jgi:hypothetical protein